MPPKALVFLGFLVLSTSSAEAGALVTRSQMQQSLASPRNSVRHQLLRRLLGAARPDRTLAPAEAASLRGDDVRLWQAVVRLTGARRLTVDELDRALPAAAAEVLAGEPKEYEPLRARVEASVLRQLRAGYREVLAGRERLDRYSRRYRVWDPQLKALRDFDPVGFAPLALGGGVRTGLKVEFDDRTLALFSRLWKSEVLTQKLTRDAFVERFADRGLTPQIFLRLYREDPERFPPVETGLEAQAEYVARVTREVQAEMIKPREEDVVARLNDDPGYYETWGTISKKQYQHMKGRYDGIPRSISKAEIKRRLVAAYRALLDQDPDLTKTAAAALLRPRYPRLAKETLIRATAGLGHTRVSRPESQREADARRLARAVAKQPGATLFALGEELGLDKPYVQSLYASFRETILAAYRPEGRRSLVYDLAARIGHAIDIMIPGGGTDEIVSLLESDPWVAERWPGIDKFTIADLRKRFGAEVVPHIERRNARLWGEIADEYARRAEGGTSEAEVGRRIRAHYPAFPRNLWQLKQQLGGNLDWSGRGERVPSPRFAGGWDPIRALGTERAGRLEPFRRIPPLLPLLRAVAATAPPRPLARANLVMVPHLLGSMVALVDAFREAGASPKRTFIVGIPYGSNGPTERSLAARGYKLRVPKLEMDAFKAAVEAALDDAVASHRKNGEPIVVLDDGGLVVELLHTKAKYAPYLHRIKIVEQTTNGIRAAERFALRVPVIDVAGSRAKRDVEGPFIGEAVARKLSQALARLDAKVEREPVAVLGFGAIGSAVAAELRRAGAAVVVLETDPARRAAARAAGFRVTASKRLALGRARIAVGTTGERSLDAEALSYLPDGAHVVSASSKQVEIDVDAIREQAVARQSVVPREPGITQRSTRYRLKDGRSLTLVADGWPVNFDGDVEDIAPEKIQLTRALMFAGALQALGVRGTTGFVPLDRDREAQVLKLFGATVPRGR